MVLLTSQSSFQTFGLEKLTMVERFITLLPLPYAVGCAVWAAYTSLGGFFFIYLDTFDINRALVYYLGRDPASVPPFQILSQLSLSFVGAFSIFYTVRYMRMKLVAAMAQLMPSPLAEETFRRLFGRVSSAKWAVLLTAPFLVIPAPSLISGELPIARDGSIPAPGIFSLIDAAIAFSLIFLAFFTFVWVYFSSIWGVHKLGKEIELKAFYEDNALGVRPIGGLSLSLAFGLFVGVGSFVLVSGSEFSPSSGPLGSMVIIVLVGLAMFFVPLNSLHRRMVEAKKREELRVREQFRDLAKASSSDSRDSSNESLGRMQKILMLEVTERKVASIPTWPFDTRIIARLAAIILSVIIILIGRYFTRLVLGL